MRKITELVKKKKIIVSGGQVYHLKWKKLF